MKKTTTLIVSVQLKMLDIEVLIPTVVVRDSTTAKYCKKRNDITLEICKQNVSELYYKKGERKYESVM